MNRPLVCICIPNYNGALKIEEMIESLINQTYKNIKIKIFDNVSTDDSVKIIKKYMKKYKNIELIENEKNIGGEENFTKCIQNGEGEYTAVFHSDDMYVPTIIEEQVLFLEKNKNYAGVGTAGYKIDFDSNIIGTTYMPNEFINKKCILFQDQYSLFKKVLQHGNFIICPSVMAKTKIYKEDIKIWNGNTFKTSADLDVWLRLSNLGGFAIINKPLIKYRISNISYSYKNTRTRLLKDDLLIVVDFYMQKLKNMLSTKDIENYKFLYFKDNVNITINQVISGKIDKLKLEIFSPKIIKSAFTCKKNFKIYIAGIAIKLLRNIPLNKRMRDKLFEIRFNKGLI